MSSSPSSFSAAILGRCPRCGKGSLFSGIMRINDACSVCHLSLKAQDSGDGPIFFALVIVGFISIGFSGFIELRYQPSWWVHVVTFVPFTCILTFLVMRFFKAWLIALQFRHRPDTLNE